MNINETWNKLHWSIKAILEALGLGIIVYIIITLLNLIPKFKEIFQMPWLYFFIALIIIALIFEVIELKLKTKNKKYSRK